MYSEYQEEFVYGIIWCVVLFAVATTIAIIFMQGFLHAGPMVALITLDVVMLYGMKKYTAWIRKNRKGNSHNQAL